MSAPDVVGIGCCVLDELLLLDRYPVEGVESGTRVKAYSLQGGGPAATAMAAVARLGARAGFVGKIGDDDRGRKIREGLREAGGNPNAEAGPRFPGGLSGRAMR